MRGGIFGIIADNTDNTPIHYPEKKYPYNNFGNNIDVDP